MEQPDGHGEGLMEPKVPDGQCFEPFLEAAAYDKHIMIKRPGHHEGCSHHGVNDVGEVGVLLNRVLILRVVGQFVLSYLELLQGFKFVQDECFDFQVMCACKLDSQGEQAPCNNTGVDLSDAYEIDDFGVVDQIIFLVDAFQGLLEEEAYEFRYLVVDGISAGWYGVPHDKIASEGLEKHMVGVA